MGQIQASSVLVRSFNPRAPGGARLYVVMMGAILTSFQSTRPRRGAIPHPCCRWLLYIVSIHAPPEGRDEGYGPIIIRAYRVSIHAPPEGRDITTEAGVNARRCFNPRAPGGARCDLARHHHDTDKVSIHAPPEGRDKINQPKREDTAMFQSTRPRRGAIDAVIYFI